MLEKLVPLRWLLEPVIGVLFLALWLLSQIGQDVHGTVAVVFLAASIALSRIAPSTALGIAALGVLLNLVSGMSMAGGAQWPGYAALLLTVFGIASHGRSLTRWLALAGALLVGPVGAYLVVFGGGFESVPVLSAVSTPSDVRFTLIALVLSIGQVVGWLIGLVVSRQRLTQRAVGSSVLVWLAQSGGTRVSTSDVHGDAVLVRRLSRGQLVTDIVIAAAFFLLAASADLGQGTRVLLVLLGLSIAVAIRRLSPPVALGIAWFSAIGQMLGGESIKPENVAILAVLYATASYGDRLTRWAGMISAGLGAVVAALYLTLTRALSPYYYLPFSSRLGELALLFVFLVVVAATVLELSWVLGLLARTWRNARASRRAQAAAEEQRLQAQQSVVVEQERNRIARDMHDVVAHSLAVVIAQADGARYLRQSDPGSVDEALSTISSTARQALGEVRLLLGELRHSASAAPQPGIDDLEPLVEQMRHAGLTILSENEGTRPPLATGTQIAVYRIVQEALTNALRHGDTHHAARLSLSWREDGVRLTVTNRVPETNGVPETNRAAEPADAHAGSVGTASSADGTGGTSRAGHGVPGMRERAVLSGGWLRTEAGDGRFTVLAYLPVAARSEATA